MIGRLTRGLIYIMVALSMARIMLLLGYELPPSIELARAAAAVLLAMVIMFGVVTLGGWGAKRGR